MTETRGRISFVVPAEVRNTATCEPGAMKPLTPAGPDSEMLNAIVPACGDRQRARRVLFAELLQEDLLTGVDRRQRDQVGDRLDRC